MTISLQAIANTYLADTATIEANKVWAQARIVSIATIQKVIADFIKKRATINAFYVSLEGFDWYGRSTLLQINTFAKNYHDDSDEAIEQFRNILVILNAFTVGECIELFYNLLLKERERLRRAGKSSGAILTPGSSSYIIPQLALWRDPTHDPYTCTEFIRNGIQIFIAEHLIPPVEGLRLHATSIEINSRADYAAYQKALDSVIEVVPALKYSPFWSDFFFSWLHQHRNAVSTLIKETNSSTILSQMPTKSATIQENPITYNILVSAHTESDPQSIEQSLLIAHEQLKPTPEPLLTQLIHEVQQHILIDEAVIRRIYHALLAGHVILTGPPGTGKTELARIIPEILWQSRTNNQEENDARENEQSLTDLNSETAYTTRLVTATDDWSARTLISGIVPQSKNGSVTYAIQYGHLTAAILKNWSFQHQRPEEWSSLALNRTRINANSGIERNSIQTFRGQWLVIDEFNRAPIDLALGDALTALGGNDVLRVAIESGSAELPIPQDFRIIGTLNSFDRHYLNQISEALKRRFSFVEILPPTRAQQRDEQSIVLYKALKKVLHLSNSIKNEDDVLYWSNSLHISTESDGRYALIWDDEEHPFRRAFERAWSIFEIIRIYRQLGTAQAINLVRHMLIAGLLQGYNSSRQWIEGALDAALCDTLADQLQVLLPDEVEVLLLYLTSERESFADAYNKLLIRLTSTPQRLYGQLLSLASVTDAAGEPYLTDIQVEQIAAQDQPQVPANKLTGIFQLEQEPASLPQFTRRLRAFKAERGL